MDCALGERRSITWLGFILAFLAFVVCLLPAGAWAARFAFRSYGTSQGLTNLAGGCITSDRAGHILVCSEHGVFAYDGRSFVNLGPSQGLRDGGDVYDLVVTATGRIVVRYADQLFVSDLAAPDASPASLVFRPVSGSGANSFYEDNRHQLAPWGDGVAIIVGERTMQVVVPASGGRPRFAPIGYDGEERAALDRPARIFSIHGQLWETFEDGRVCSATPRSVRCFGPGQGLAKGPWMDIVAGAAGTILARSPDAMASIDPGSGRVTEERLPDQGGPYLNYANLLGLFRTPSGELFTQSTRGLIVRRPSGWTELTVQDGIPAGIVTAALHDAEGQLWLHLLGHGLDVGLGYGHWESLQKSDGLSGDIAWQAVRAPGGSLWVSTDTGTDEVRQIEGEPRVVRVVPGASFALAVGPDGDIWSSAGETDIRVIDPRTGSFSRLATPPINAIVSGSAGRVWLGTENGLYTVDGRPGATRTAIRDGPLAHVIDLANDGAGGVWLLSGGRLWHRHADGSRVPVTGPWPARGFEPLVLALAPDGRIWIGGGGGLYVLSLAADRITSCVAVPQADIRSNSVVAVLVDHQGWVWVGTDQGISVFDGHRWVSADTSMGLVWNDVSQGGIAEDADGSIWIVTSDGLSHLIDRSWLFSRQKLRVVIAEATLGARPLPSGRLPYTTAPLSIQFGTSSYASDKSVVFHYRLSGVDQGWATSATGAVHYPFVPPGHRVLTLVGDDVLGHVLSPPVSLVIDIGFPWWRQWWAWVAYLAFAAGLLCGAVAWRGRQARRRERQLEALVDERTREMRFAQAELRRQATVDGLTGLLNRGEFQRRLAESLASGRPGDLVLAMIDLDHFKRINDEHGHLAGDDLICAMGTRIAAILRANEYAGRYGGEEFIVVLDDADGQGASRILVLHQSIGLSPFLIASGQIAVTCSIGVAWAMPGESVRPLVGRADAALYAAKNAGRDRIVESSPALPLAGERLRVSPGAPGTPG